MSRRSSSRWSGRRFPRLAVWPLESRDLPHGLAAMPDDSFNAASFVGPLQFAGQTHTGIAGHSDGDNNQHGDMPMSIALEGDPSMQAVGPFYMSPGQLNPPIVGSIPGA